MRSIRNATHFEFEAQHSRQTLRDGLAELHALSGLPLTTAEMFPPEIRAGLGAHDAAHVVFGCDTSIRGEVVLSRWSLLGATDFAMIYLRALRTKEARRLYVDALRQLRVTAIAAGFWQGLVAMVRALRMSRRWPTFDFQKFLDRPLADIRREFNIRVI